MLVSVQCHSRIRETYTSDQEHMIRYLTIFKDNPDDDTSLYYFFGYLQA